MNLRVLMWPLGAKLGIVMCAFNMLSAGDRMVSDHFQESPALSSKDATKRWEKPDELVERIINRVVRRGQGRTKEGVMFYTFVPPSNEDLSEITEMGEAAVPHLEHHIWAGNKGPERMIALRLLGSMEMKLSLGPLKKIARGHPASGMRDLGLRWLVRGPRDLVEPILREAAEKDPNERVRATANSLLQTFKDQNQ